MAKASKWSKIEIESSSGTLEGITNYVKTMPSLEYKDTDDMPVGIKPMMATVDFNVIKPVFVIEVKGILYEYEYEYDDEEYKIDIPSVNDNEVVVSMLSSKTGEWRVIQPKKVTVK